MAYIPGIPPMQQAAAQEVALTQLGTVMQDATHLPKSCQKCKRWQECGTQYHKVLPQIYKGNPNSNALDILFVLPSPDPENAKAGQVFALGDAAELFHKMVGRLRLNYAVIGAAMCGGIANVSKHQWQKCEEHVDPLIDHMAPKVLVLMGEASRDAVLGFDVSLSDAHKNVFLTQSPNMPAAIPCLLAPDPRGQFYAAKAKDLRPVLAEVYDLAETIVRGQYIPWDNDLEWQVINTGSRDGDAWAYREFVSGKNAELEISLDLEFDVEEDETIWEDGCGGIVTVQSCIYDTDARKYRAVVLDVRDWEPEDLAKFFKMAFLSKSLVGSFIQIDNQAAWVNTAEIGEDGNFQNGVDVFNFSRDFEDGHIVDWLQDQSLHGSGLKGRTTRDYGWPDWSVFFKHGLKKAKAKGLKGIPSNIEDLTALYRYAAQDSYAELKWWREKGRGLVHNVSLPYAEMKDTIRTLLELSRQGVHVDVEKLAAYKGRLEIDIEVMKQWINKHPWVKAAGLEELNVKSPQQVTAVCRAMGIPFKETETGLAMVNKDTLPELAGGKDPAKRTTPQQQFFGVLWDQRVKRDMISKSVLPFMRYQQNGWCHPLYSNSKQDRTGDEELGTVTGRMSATKPNPMAQDKTPEYQEAFTPPPGHVIVAYDFKTGEPVINGYLSQCRPLMEAFELGARDPGNPYSDPYRLFMAKKLGKLPEALEKAERDRGKVPWLSAGYGKFPQTIADETGITLQEAEQILYDFYSQYPELLAREALVYKKLFAGGLFVTAMGRRRTFPLLRHYPYNYEKHRAYMGWQLVKELRMGPLDAEAMRQASNNEIQGPLGIITFYFMNYFRANKTRLGCKGLADWKMYLSVHDSVKFYAPERPSLRDEVERVHQLMKEFWHYLPAQVVTNLGFPSGIPVLQNDWEIGEDAGNMVKMEKALAGGWEWL